MRALSITDIESLMARANPQLRAMIAVGFYHGARNSEICGLLHSDLDMGARTIFVRRLKNSIHTRQPIGDAEYQILKEWLVIAPQSKYVFPGRSGYRMTRNGLYKSFHKACLDAGLPKDKAFVHILKHSLGRYLVQANVNIAVIKQALGHKSLNSTNCYTLMDDETTGAIVLTALRR
jgi:type 1 fimbriae regulatory protein FimB